MFPKTERHKALAAALLTFSVLVLGLGVTWSLVGEQWRRNVQDQLDQTATQASLRLQDFVRSRLMAVQALGQTSALDTALSPEEFSSRSSVLQKNFGGFQALNWVALDATIEIVVPFEANRGALGKSVLAHPIASSAFRIAQANESPELTRPLELFQGGRGVAAYVPIVRQGRAIGYLNAVFRLKDLVEDSLGAGMLDSHTLLIVDEETPLYESTTHAVASSRPFGEATVQVLERTWVLRTHPDGNRWASMKSSRPRWVFIVALALSLFASLLVRSALLRRWHKEQAQQDRLALQVELERSARMRALGRLAGGVAHDFNNILTAIVGTAELMSLTTPTDEVKVGARDIISSAERAGDLTQQLLVFSNTKQPPEALVDVNEQMEDMRRMLGRLVSEDIAVQVDLGANVPRLMCSRGQLSQILVNLVVNAADAMPNGGTILMSTRVRFGGAGGLVAGTDRWIVVSVRDTGTGMDEETRRRIFEPFFSTKGNNRRGAGLGLASVYGIVQNLHGDLRVESTLGEGTTFEIWLPCSDRAASDEGRSLIDGQQVESKTLLFVEDDHSVRKVIAKSLRLCGHMVVEAESGAEALDVIEAGEHIFDAVITDAVMPKLSGPKLIERLRSSGYTMPVILVSGYSEELSDEQELRRRGVHFLAKPYLVEELLGVLGQSLAPDLTEL